MSIEQSTVEPAAQEYLDRQDRRSHPAGRKDSGGRWYPSAEERRACCDGVRSPSRAWPWSLMVHCRTAAHVARLYGVEERELRRAVAAERKPRRACADGVAYKAVAVLGDGRMVSIYDGQTEYVLGQTVTAGTPHQGHNGGIYVYQTAAEARDAAVPPSSVLGRAPRLILRCRVEGAYCRYDNGKLAFARVTPLEVVAE